MKTELTYKDINLIPKKCIVSSRKECDTRVLFGNRKFEMPIFPANMKSVINENTCIYLAKQNWFYTMHRFGIDNSQFINRMHENNLFASISVGVNDEHHNDIIKLAKNKIIPEYVTIDIANAWCEKTKNQIATIKDHMPSAFIIVGNIATAEAAIEIEGWGASAIKVGIAGGKVCITRNKTGFYRGMVSSILECKSAISIPIIADGGIEHHGDIAKAISCGATMVMAGFLFAGYDESAGEVIEINEQQYKQYYGSASKYNKEEIKNIEGKKILIPYHGSMNKLLKELKEDLQSSISYAGGFDLSAFKNVKKGINV